MRCLNALILTASALALTACASVRTYDMAKVSGEMGQSVQAEAVIQKAESDYREKGVLVDNLKRAGSPEYREVEDQLQHGLAAMKSSLEVMHAKRKAMREASGQISALAYTRSEVRSDEPEYDRVTDAVHSFQDAAKGINAAVLDYSRESNSLADLVAQKKLYFNFDVKEFHKRVQQAIKAAQTNTDAMNKELGRAQSLLNNWNRPESRDASEEIYKTMTTHAGNYATRAGQLPEISKQMNSVTMGSARISTLDSSWPAVNKVVEELDRTIEELKDLNEKFQADVERFRNPAKRAQ